MHFFDLNASMQFDGLKEVVTPTPVVRMRGISWKISFNGRDRLEIFAILREDY